jgi:hypothetical protein
LALDGDEYKKYTYAHTYISAQLKHTSKWIQLMQMFIKIHETTVGPQNGFNLCKCLLKIHELTSVGPESDELSDSTFFFLSLSFPITNELKK